MDTRKLNRAMLAVLEQAVRDEGADPDDKSSMEYEGLVQAEEAIDQVVTEFCEFMGVIAGIDKELAEAALREAQQ